MTHASPAQGPPSQFIFLIRHAEKPVVTDGATDTGLNVTGTPNPDCLIPQGWQRAGGLANLFDTAVGTMRTDLAVPGHLYSPAYSDPVKTVNHRTYETALPLSLKPAKSAPAAAQRTASTRTIPTWRTPAVWAMSGDRTSSAASSRRPTAA